MLTLVRDFVGMILGGWLGRSCVTFIMFAIASTGRHQAKGFAGDLTATLGLLAIPCGFWVGAVSGGLLVLKWSDGYQ
jgi:hypothetical protein